MFDTGSKSDLRRTYCEAWRKQGCGMPLSPLEAMIADVIGLHPEYQAVVEDAGRAMAFEPGVGEGDHNPFLHMGLHLAVREQVGIDRPPGVRDLHAQLCHRLGNAHEAEHVLGEALAETLWQAQRDGRTPDESRYLGLARSRLAGAK